MQTGAKRPMDKKGEFEGVEAIRIDTGSIVPRSNRRHIRKVLTEGLGVKPQYVKYAMQQLDFWSVERLGIPCGFRRNQLYAEAVKHAKDNQSEPAG